MKKLYLDVCALHRPFDNLDDVCIRLESDAIIDLLKKIVAGHYLMCSSDMIAYETKLIPSFEIREFIGEIVKTAAFQRVAITPAQIKCASALEKRGLNPYDALHLAAAAAGACDYFLTPVHRLLRGGKQWVDGLAILNPLDFYIQEFLQQRHHEKRRHHQKR